MIKRVKNIIQNSLKLQIMIMFVISMAAAYFISWFFMSEMLFRPLENERRQNLESYMDKTVEEIRNQKELCESTAIELAYNRVVAKIMSAEYENYTKIWESMSDLKSIVQEGIAISGVKGICLYYQGGSLGEDGEYIKCSDFQENYSDAVMLWENDNEATYENDATSIVLYQKVEGLINGIDAYVKISVNTQNTFGSFIQTDKGSDESIYMINNDNIVIAASDSRALNDTIDNIVGIDFSSYRCNEIYEIGDEIAMKVRIDNNWTLWVSTPVVQISNMVEQARGVTMVTFAFFVIIISAILWLLMSKVFGRIIKIGERMEHVLDDTASMDADMKSDEVGRLEAGYQQMVLRLNQAINDIANEKTQKQVFELKAIETQINPHFLYNTLGAMRWEALEADNGKLVRMIDNLADFYRLSLNKGRSFLEIDSEVKLIKTYIKIQQTRYDDIVQVSYDIDESVKNIIIPKMILQPLIENIWVHGNITLEGNRKIQISIKDRGNNIEIQIKDNGSGINEQTLQELFKKTSENSRSSGIGIGFINDILTFYYGSNFIYHIDSVENVGTNVQIILPKKMEDKS